MVSKHIKFKIIYFDDWICVCICMCKYIFTCVCVIVKIIIIVSHACMTEAYELPSMVNVFFSSQVIERIFQNVKFSVYDICTKLNQLG